MCVNLNLLLDSEMKVFKISIFQLNNCCCFF